MAFADDVKEYSRAEEDVTGFIAAAEAYLVNAGIATAESDPLYALAVKMMVTQWYENRNTNPEGSNGMPRSRGLDGIILQLQLKAAVS